MDYLPIYTLDLETRLAVDKLAYEEHDFDRETLEGKAFIEFHEQLVRLFSNTEEEVKNEKHSLELLMLERDINVIMALMNEYETELNSFTFLREASSNLIYIKLDMALRYRYTLGLYETDETFESYHARKTRGFEAIKKETYWQYTLPTFIVPLEQIRDDSRIAYVDIIQETAAEMLKQDDRFNFAVNQLTGLLSDIELPTKKNWSGHQSGWCFGYMEQRAIQAEIILHLKNGLRDAYLNDDNWEIQKYIDALNILYFVNLKVSGAEVEQTPAQLPKVDYIDASYINTGVLGVSMHQASMTYADNVRMLGTRGHGIAAERANDLIDKVLGNDAKILGDDNAKDGADRLVNGDAIQTKYCSTGGKAISECFENGKFRYVVDGKPMQIEVPKDKYEQAVQSMRDRIQRGDLQELGITDPDYAEKIVRKGHIRYKTAQRIAKAGTIEGISYDAAKGMVTGLQTFGVSATISFATAIWRGENAEEALEQALKDGTQIFGRHVMQHVLTQQVGRTAIEKSLRPATDYVVKNVLGSKTSAQIVNTFFRAASQRSIHGAAAMNNLSKIFRGNIVTMTITTAVLSAGSIYDVINGRISRSQLFKNIGTTGASVGGAAAGAAIGSVVPVVGTFIGGIVGGFIGGKMSKKALDLVIEDDTIETMETLKHLFVENIEELQLDRDELNYIAGKVFNPKTLPKELKLIYATANEEEYISDKLEPYIEAILKARPKIKDVGTLVEHY